MLICRVAKNLPALELLNHFIKSSTVAYKRVAYKRNLFFKTNLNVQLLKFDENKLYPENAFNPDHCEMNVVINKIMTGKLTLDPAFNP